MLCDNIKIETDGHLYFAGQDTIELAKKYETPLYLSLIHIYQLIEETLEAFNITRSLSHKGCPYDNAVAEATFKIIKTEFVKNQTFADLDLSLIHI